MNLIHFEILTLDFAAAWGLGSTLCMLLLGANGWEGDGPGIETLLLESEDVDGVVRVGCVPNLGTPILEATEGDGISGWAWKSEIEFHQNKNQAKSQSKGVIQWHEHIKNNCNKKLLKKYLYITDILLMISDYHEYYLAHVIEKPNLRIPNP